MSPHELLDFGGGRKLERFGDWIVDRPSPAAEGHKAARDCWEAQWRFERLAESSSAANSAASSEASAGWRRQPGVEVPSRCVLAWNELRLELRPTPFGHLGVFPEQAENWQWLARRVARAKRLKVLNLFAYTGAATLAAAGAGAEVVHVDAARNIVSWARRNAELTLGPQAPIRWIHDDARKFVDRELRRGNRYDAVILDPPTYGHGARGEPWKIQRHLPDLLQACAELTNRKPAFLLLTCHSPGFGPAELEALLADTFFGSCQAGARGFQLELKTAAGRRLPCGAGARYPF